MLSSSSSHAVTNRTVSSKTLVSLNGIGKPPLCRQGNLSTMSPVYSVNDVSGSDPPPPVPLPQGEGGPCGGGARQWRTGVLAREVTAYGTSPGMTTDYETNVGAGTPASRYCTLIWG